MNKNTKIPCSVGILTLNSAGGLRKCLASLKDFEEIVICDGNSTDETKSIALEFGAKIIPQYDSFRPSLPCVKDKASVRQKNMEASTLDWYFFMDSDDTLSEEVVQEIRQITQNPHIKHFAYKMPTRIFIGEKEILHEASYPSYQLRLVHKSINPYFKGDVHERIVFDEKKYSTGTLSHYYNFVWSEERVRHFPAYLKRYAYWETEFVDYRCFSDFFLKGVVRRVGIICKYLFYRLPFMYMRFGFKDSMPLSIELSIVRYHGIILRRLISVYVSSRNFFVFVKETLKGKDIYRIINNIPLFRKEIFGEILDIGCGTTKPSYYRFFRMPKFHFISSVDIDQKRNPTFVCDLNKESIPSQDDAFDFVLAFNVFEHLSDRQHALGEVFRVLKKGGRLIGCVPFLVNVHPDPFDYVRYTSDELNAFFAKAGFSSISITAIGVGPFTVAYSMVEWILPRVVKIFLYPVVYMTDVLLQKIWKKDNLREKYPLAYLFDVKK